MKNLLLVLLALVAGCSAPKTGKITVMPLPSAVLLDDLTERVRYPEAVKAYHVSRYVDPNHRLLLHEAHTVYRVESQAVWNLHPPPGGFLLPTAAGALTNATFVPPPINDAVVAELNQQRVITQAVTQQAEALNGSLRDFTGALSYTRNLVEQNKTLREQLSKTEQRLDALEAALKKQNVSPPSPRVEAP